MAATIIGLYIITSDSFSRAYQPVYFGLASSQNQKEAKEKIRDYNHYLIMITLLMIFLITFFSREAIVFLLDSRYHEAAKIIPFLGLAYGASFLHTTINLAIYQEKKTHITSVIYILSAAIHIVGSICLIPTFGIYGAAYALIITNTFYSITGYYISKRYYFVAYKWDQIVLSIVSFTGLIILFIFLSDVNFLWAFYAKVLLVLIAFAVIYRKFQKQIMALWTNSLAKDSL